MGAPSPGKILGHPGVLILKPFDVINITMKTSPDPGLREFLKKAYLLQLREGSFSAASLARETGKSYGYTSGTLARLLSSGFVRRLRDRALLGSGGKSCLRGFSPACYALTSQGRSGVRVVMTGGVFDILHPGHLAALKESKKQGDVLVVVIARDSTVRKRKGIMPVNREPGRLLMVSSLRQADAAILGSERSFSETIRRVSPDAVCLGYDQKTELSYLKGFTKRSGKDMEVIRLDMLPGHSTRDIMKKIKGTKAYNNL
jgi:FAD synthetase